MKIEKYLDTLNLNELAEYLGISRQKAKRFMIDEGIEFRELRGDYRIRKEDAMKLHKRQEEKSKAEKCKVERRGLYYDFNNPSCDRKRAKEDRKIG